MSAIEATVVCPICDEQNDDTAAVCTSCGARLFPPEPANGVKRGKWKRPKRKPTVIVPPPTRFVVSEVSGYPVDTETGPGLSHSYRTIYSVLDTGNCHGIVKSFKGYRKAAEKAARYADKLNREYA